MITNKDSVNRRGGRKESCHCNPELLRHYRTRKSLTQNQLARLSGYSERLISKAESGRAISRTTVEILAQALSTGDDELSAEDLILDPILLAKEYVNSFYVHQEKFVDEILHFLDEAAVLQISGPTEEFSVEERHQGVDEIRDLFQSFWSFYDVPPGHDHRPHYKFFGNGNEVVIWGECWIHPKQEKPGKPLPVNTLLKFQFGKLVAIQQRFGINPH